MIEYLQDKDDKIIAFVDWKLIDKFGKLDNFGTYCWVDNFFMHPSLNIFLVMQEFAERIIKRASWIEYLYFQRYEKYGDRWKLYKANTILRRIKYGWNKNRNSASPDYACTVSK
jgi:hypothetical protein